VSGNVTFAAALIDEPVVYESAHTITLDEACPPARHGEFSKFWPISADAITLEAIAAVLKPNEAYFKLSVIGQSTFAMFADNIGSTRYKIPITAAALEVLRNPIAVNRGGHVTPHAFDVALARKLYGAQRLLMDNTRTSHPIIGQGSQ
jgi:hypothetical protein